MSRLDVVIFGATGFTGKYTIKNLVKVAKTKNFTWGVAGRNKEKLLKTLTDMVGEDMDISKIPLIIADLENSSSLEEMAKQAKVILNCCGPYRFYGEQVVKACIANKTHHVDVSGEPQYMEKMQVKYHEEAKQNEVYVISACGFDSIPADLGLVFVKDKFEGQLNSAEIYLDSKVVGEKNGSTVHYGTWESAVYGVGHRHELRSIRKKLFTQPLPRLKPTLKSRFPPIFKCDALNGKWCLPFPGSDKAVIRRSQYHFFSNDQERPVQVATYVAFPSFIASIMVLMAAAVFGVLVRFHLGRKLLLAYPDMLSFGFASREGPPENEADNTHFSFTFIAEGWKEKLSEATDCHVEAPNKKMVARVSGTNPGYGATCIFLIMSGLTILEESDKMPNKGGVYPPGAAFAKTSMVKQLSAFGINFEVIEDK
ncbi:hypothetical protein RUM43_008586 [Polyplax serrata]|uniref:Saccharopine dehydrogenase NADP binding domain-containing protein n=1 Tax=Polyplax serrata TaxID=468196 RepID=A0AAN8S1E9_POLSC